MIIPTRMSVLVSTLVVLPGFRFRVWFIPDVPPKGTTPARRLKSSPPGAESRSERLTCGGEGGPSASLSPDSTLRSGDGSCLRGDGSHPAGCGVPLVDQAVSAPTRGRA